MNFSPITDLFEDKCVDQQMRLVEKPTQYTKNENDWPISGNLESLDRSDSSIDSKSSSVDSGKTIAGPRIPVMDAHDISQVESFVDTTPDSYLDVSFMSIKKSNRLNLSRQDKLNILEGMPPSSGHSTPVRSRDLRPKLSTSFKKQAPSRPQVSRPSYVTAFLNKWFKSQVANMTAELQKEMEQLE